MSEGFPSIALGAIANITMGQSPGSETYSSEENGLPFLQGCAEFGALYPQPEICCDPPLRVAKKDSVLISVRAPVGTMNLADQDYCIGRGLGAVQGIAGKANTSFLRYAIAQNVGFLHRKSQGSTFLAIGSGELRLLPVPDIGFTTQGRIAEILSTLDKTIEKTQALIAKHQQIKAGLMHDLFTRGVTADGKLRPPREQVPELYQQTRIGWIPKEWAVAGLDQACQHIVDCPHSTPNFVPSGVLVARTMHIKDGIFLEDIASRVSETEYRERVARLMPMAGDVVFTREAPVGEAFVIPDETRICLGQRVMLIRPKASVLDSNYLVAQIYSGSLSLRISELTAGTTNPHLNVADVRNLAIAVPSFPEQTSMTKRIKTINAYIQQQRESLEKLKLQKFGLMHDLLTGYVHIPAVKTKEGSTMNHTSTDLEPNT